MADTTKNIYEVQVAGVSLKLRSSHGEETVSDLIKFVEQKIQEAMRANSSASFQNSLILAALNIAEELILLKKTTALELDKVEDRARRILDQIEDVTATTN